MTLCQCHVLHFTKACPDSEHYARAKDRIYYYRAQCHDKFKQYIRSDPEPKRPHHAVLECSLMTLYVYNAMTFNLYISFYSNYPVQCQ